MAHAFDTALAAPQRTVVRRRVVELLSGLKRPAGYLHAVVPVGLVIRGNDDGVDMLRETLAGRSPSIAVALGDRTTTAAGVGGFQWLSTLEVLVYHCAKSPRDMLSGRMEIDAAGLASDTADPGLDVMMEHAEELLAGQFARGLVAGRATVKDIRPVREEELYTDHEITIWSQTYTVALSRTIDEWRGLDELLDEVRSRLKLEPTDANLPDPPTSSGSLDVNTDGLAP